MFDNIRYRDKGNITLKYPHCKDRYIVHICEFVKTLSIFSEQLGRANKTHLTQTGI